MPALPLAVRRLVVALPLALAPSLGTAAPLAAQAADARAALVVSPAWLAAHLRDADLVLLHVGDRAEYDKAHIPGARYVSLKDVSVSSMDHETGLMLEMPSPDSLRAQLERLGISDRSRVVVYYGNDWVSPATRVMFTLDYAGLGAHGALLDGGMPAWVAESHAVTAEVPEVRVGRLAPLRTRPLVVDAAWVKARLGTPGFHLVDGRAAVFYDGVEEAGPRKGHVAGARNVPFTSVTDEHLKLRTPAELAALFDGAGIGPRDTVVAYCHIGQQATAVLFAARTLGHPVLLYDGSFQEWSRRTDLPVENPAAGGTSRP